MTTTTTARAAGTGEQGAQSLTNDITAAKSAIERGDWVDAGLSITNVAMDVVNIAGDPLGAAGAAGFGWIIQHISFLREPFDALLGDANSILGSSQGWTKTGDQLAAQAAKLRSAARDETVNWLGAAGENYRRAATTQAQGLEALSQVSKGIGQAISGAGQLLAEVRKTVLDFINKCVQKVIQIIIEALAKSWLSFGASIAEGIARSVAEAVQTAQKIFGKVQKFISSLQKILQTVRKVVDLAKSVKQLLETIGGKASSAPKATTTQAPAVRTDGIDRAADARYTTPGGTSAPTYHQQAAPRNDGFSGYQPRPTQGPTYQQGQTVPSYTAPTPLPQSTRGQITTPYTPGPGDIAKVPLIGPSGPPPTPGAPASRVDRARWIGDAVEILINHGVDPGRINPEQIAQIIDRNSGGNPHAIGAPDPNTPGATPPKGLMQITDPVFQQHQVPGHGDIWSPVDNVLAGVLHLLTTWGTLLAAFNATAPMFTTQAQ